MRGQECVLITQWDNIPCISLDIKNKKKDNRILFPRRQESFAICYRCDAFTYLQIGRSSRLFAKFVLSCDQHIFVDVLLQTFDGVDRQVELNSKHQVR